MAPAHPRPNIARPQALRDATPTPNDWRREFSSYMALADQYFKRAGIAHARGEFERARNLRNSGMAIYGRLLNDWEQIKQNGRVAIPAAHDNTRDANGEVASFDPAVFSTLRKKQEPNREQNQDPMDELLK